MIKRLLGVVVLMLALNFLALGGVVGWLFQSGHLNKQRVADVRELLFPATQPAAAATQPAAEPDAPTDSMRKLEALLARHSKLPAGQQVDLIRQTFDSQMAQLDRRTRELTDLKAQVDLASAKLAEDRAALEADRKKLTDQRDQSQKLAQDQGFQDSLAVYNSLPARQVKAIFLTMNDDTVMQYLQAMQPRTAAKIVKEFKSPDEIERVHKILDKMRQGESAATDPKG